MKPEVGVIIERYQKSAQDALDKGYLAVEIRSADLLQLCQALSASAATSMTLEVEADVDMAEDFARKGKDYLHLIDPDEILNICQALRALDARIAELEKDKARMDWIEWNDNADYLRCEAEHGFYIDRGELQCYDTAREAIDAALAQKGGGE